MRSNSLLAVALVLTTLLLTACGGGGGDSTTPPPPAPQTGTVSGTVVSAMTGVAVPGATVRSGATTVISAADGSYTLTAGVSERAIISITAAGFAETFQVARLATGRIASLEVQLLPVGVTQAITIAAGGTVTVPNSSAQVTFPPGGLIPVTGGTPAATVNVSLTPINPAIDSSLMPGDYTTLLAGSAAPVPIESFGALLVDIRDDSGTRYNLAAGQTSTIRIPLGSLSASPPTTIPLFYFNETTGLWLEEGTATLAGTAPNQYYEGTVTHFSFWNADQVMDTVFVTGCVRDAANQPVANVVVSSDGVDYSGAASAVTAADGSFRVAVRRGGLATLDVLFDRNGSLQDATVNVGPLTADFTLPSCLVTAPVPFAITTWSLPAGIVGTAYNVSLTAFNGTRPYSSWSVSADALPAGLTLASATGQISGTPTTAGTFAVTIQAQDSSTPPQLASESFNITVFPVSSGGGGGGGTGSGSRVATGGGHTCALRGSGTVRCWGENAYGQLGNGTSGIGASSSTPVTVSGITTATAIAAGSAHTCAILVSGTVQCWGLNLYGQLGNGATVRSSSTPVPVSGITTATAIAAGGAHTCAILASGTVQCWGSSYYGQLGNGTTTNSSTPVTVSGITTATTIAAGGFHTCALLSSGTAQCWGYNVFGQLGNGTTTGSSSNPTPVTVSGITTATTIVARNDHTCAALSNGTAQCWGDNSYGQLGNGTTSNSSTPVPVSGITTATAIAAGSHHTCATLSSGTVQCWGYNGAGQLGNGATSNSSTPVTVSGITTATAIATGDLHTCAVLSSGTVQCWGWNGTGGLGNGTTTDSSTPVPVSGL